MNQDGHQRERMRVWTEAFSIFNKEIPAIPDAAEYADSALAEFDKRFPAPAAVEPEPRINIEWPACGDAELASLRTKARLWDAVASGKVQLEMYPSGTACVSWEHGDRTYPTAAEAVEAAIAAGALK